MNRQAPRRYTGRNRQVGIYKPRPQKSLYDGDVYIKVDKVVELIFDLATSQFWSGARTDAATSTGSTDISYLDQPDYQIFSGQNTFMFCEVRGIKANVTIAQHVGTTDRVVRECTMFAGPASGIPIATPPIPQRLAGLPVIRQCNLQGQATDLYFDVSRAMRNTGQIPSVQHNGPYPATSGYAIYVYGSAAGFANLATIGSVKFTYYIRLHQRKYIG